MSRNLARALFVAAPLLLAACDRSDPTTQLQTYDPRFDGLAPKAVTVSDTITKDQTKLAPKSLDATSQPATAPATPTTPANAG